MSRASARLDKLERELAMHVSNTCHVCDGPRPGFDRVVVVGGETEPRRCVECGLIVDARGHASSGAVFQPAGTQRKRVVLVVDRMGA